MITEKEKRLLKLVYFAVEWIGTCSCGNIDSLVPESREPMKKFIERSCNAVKYYKQHGYDVTKDAQFDEIKKPGNSDKSPGSKLP